MWGSEINVETSFQLITRISPLSRYYVCCFVLFSFLFQWLSLFHFKITVQLILAPQLVGSRLYSSITEIDNTEGTHLHGKKLFCLISTSHCLYIYILGMHRCSCSVGSFRFHGILQCRGNFHVRSVMCVSCTMWTPLNNDNISIGTFILYPREAALLFSLLAPMWYSPRILWYIIS